MKYQSPKLHRAWLFEQCFSRAYVVVVDPGLFFPYNHRRRRRLACLPAAKTMLKGEPLTVGLAQLDAQVFDVRDQFNVERLDRSSVG